MGAENTIGQPNAGRRSGRDTLPCSIVVGANGDIALAVCGCRKRPEVIAIGEDGRARLHLSGWHRGDRGVLLAGLGGRDLSCVEAMGHTLVLETSGSTIGRLTEVSVLRSGRLAP